MVYIRSFSKLPRSIDVGIGGFSHEAAEIAGDIIALEEDILGRRRQCWQENGSVYSSVA